MRFGHYITTPVGNLAEYNKVIFAGSNRHVVFMGFRKDADGISRRYYAEQDRETGTQYGEEFKIYFNEDED